MLLNDRLKKLLQERGCLCLEINAHIESIPNHYRVADNPYQSLVDFYTKIIAACSEYIMCVKFNVATFLVYGHQGLRAVEDLCKYATTKDIFTIYAADFSASTHNPHVNGSPTTQLSEQVFSFADSVTVNPYFGNNDGIDHFMLGYKSGAFITCKTQGFDEGEFQNILIDTQSQMFDYTEKFGDHIKEAGRILETNRVPLWLVAASRASHKWEFPGKCSIAISSSTLANDVLRARKVCNDRMQILVPYTKDVQQVLLNGRLQNTKNGVIVTVGNPIVYASYNADFADAAKQKAKYYKAQLT